MAMDTFRKSEDQLSTVGASDAPTYCVSAMGACIKSRPEVTTCQYDEFDEIQSELTPPPWYLNLFGYPITIVAVPSME